MDLWVSAQPSCAMRAACQPEGPVVRLMYVREEDLMKPNRSVPRTAQQVALTVAVLLLAGCGSGAATMAASQTSAATTAAPTPAQPAATPASVAAQATAASGTPSAAPAGTSTGGEVTAAVASALALFERVPRNPQDAAAGYVWLPASETADHLSPEVIARLDALRSAGYFGAGGCAEDYLTGTQNGLTAAPAAISAHGDNGGTVTVLIRRPAAPRPPDLTVVMARRNGHWLATDLASGQGASASIFTSKPHC